MKITRFWMTWLCALLLVTPPARAQQDAASATSRDRLAFINTLAQRYRATDLPPIRLQNSTRWERLLRAGRLYLSLQDTIALALENNLDIELQRYGDQLAQANLKRAEAGGLLRGLPTSVQQGPSSAQNLVTGGAGQGTGLRNDGGGNTTGGTVITATGVAIPTYDETFFFNYGHNLTNNINTNSVVTGLSTTRTDGNNWSAGFQKGFVSGTNITAVWNNTTFTSNSPNLDINPVNSSNLQVAVTQRVLQGFGFGINNRNIRIAKNNLKTTDLVFKQQVMTTVSSIVNLYWDLVSFYEDVKVRRQSLTFNEKLYSDNRKQVEIGTLAPIEVVRAEAEVARAQQELVQAETRVLQQEAILKNALSRTGVSDPAIAEARIVPTDQLRVPAVEPIAPVQDLVASALQSRPEVERTRVDIENSRIGILGSRSQLLPSLDINLNGQVNALAGSISAIPVRPGFPPRQVSPDLLGGFGTTLGQLFRGNYPNYTLGFTLNVPLRNRSAQADLIIDQVTLRRAEIQQQQQVNNIRVDVQNAITAIQQARAAYQASVKSRQLQEQNLDAEQKKYALGASTIFFVIQAQRDLSTAQGAEVQALTTYSRARTQLSLATGQVLKDFEIEVADALAGRVSRDPSPLPPEDRPENK